MAFISTAPWLDAQDSAEAVITEVHSVSNGGVAITFESQSDRLYEVQVLTNLSSAATLRIAGTMLGEEPQTTWIDASAPIVSPRYYRMRSLSFTADADGDALSNFDEFQLHTDLHQSDTDGDGLPDGWEVRFTLNPLVGMGVDGTNGDPDLDGAVNIVEFLQGRNPRAGMVVDSGLIGLDVFTPLEAAQ